MRALLLERHGGNDALRVGELPDPVPARGQVLVRIEAAALNRLDLFVRNGIPGIPVAFPHVPGADGAGVVEALGEGVTDPAPGTRVVLQPGLSCGRCRECRRGELPLCGSFRLLGEHLAGTLAELVAVPRENVFAAPSGLPVEAAAALPLDGLTAWRMLVTRARLRPGESVLIHGAGGGISTMAIQIARLCGAAPIFVTSRSPAKLARARELGADVTLEAAPDLPRRVRELTGKRGVDVVVDSVGAATWRHSLVSAAKGGRIVTCGATSGPTPEEDIRYIFWKELSILGSTMGNDAEMLAMLSAATGGKLRPVVDSVHPLSRGVEAYERLEGGEGFGKVVVTLGTG